MTCFFFSLELNGNKLPEKNQRWMLIKSKVQNRVPKKKAPPVVSKKETSLLITFLKKVLAHYLYVSIILIPFVLFSLGVYIFYLDKALDKSETTNLINFAIQAKEDKCMNHEKIIKKRINLKEEDLLRMHEKERVSIDCLIALITHNNRDSIVTKLSKKFHLIHEVQKLQELSRQGGEIKFEEKKYPDPNKLPTAILTIIDEMNIVRRNKLTAFKEYLSWMEKEENKNELEKSRSFCSQNLTACIKSVLERLKEINQKPREQIIEHFNTSRSKHLLSVFISSTILEYSQAYTRGNQNPFDMKNFKKYKRDLVKLMHKEDWHGILKDLLSKIEDEKTILKELARDAFEKAKSSLEAYKKEQVLNLKYNSKLNGNINKFVFNKKLRLKRHQKNNILKK